MLAHPADDGLAKILPLMTRQIEWKWDGARISFECKDEVRLFTNGDDISASFLN